MRYKTIENAVSNYRVVGRSENDDRDFDITDDLTIDLDHMYEIAHKLEDMREAYPQCAVYALVW